MDAAAQNTQAATGAKDAATHFIFTHKIFSIEQCKFSLNGNDKMPCFYVPFADTQVAAIELRKLKTEFNIPDDSPDAALLLKVEKGLNYVREIRPNDSIPREILDGSASWSVEQHHKDLASCKLNQELIFWMTGFRGEFPSLDTMLREQKETENRNMLKDAHKKLMQLMGVPDTKITAQRVADISREMCYIEALRERTGKVSEIAQKLASFSAAFKKETSFVAEIMRMQDLMRRALRHFGEKFQRVDGQFKEISKALSNNAATIGVIRDVRDELHMELKKWDEHFPIWAELKIERTDDLERIFRNFYRFLAENYMEQQSWGGAKKK